MTRHEMREAAFILTFERMFGNGNLNDIIATAKECDDFDIDDSVIKLTIGIDENKEIVDTTIQKYLKNWYISRISKVSLAVLRIAVYEIFFCEDIDVDISISEAVKIAQNYTYKEDVSFINGVLSSIAKEIAKSAKA